MEGGEGGREVRGNEERQRRDQFHQFDMNLDGSRAAPIPDPDSPDIHSIVLRHFYQCSSFSALVITKPLFYLQDRTTVHRLQSIGPFFLCF